MVISVRQDKHTNKQKDNNSGGVGWGGGGGEATGYRCILSVKIVFYSGFLNGKIIMCGHLVKSLSLYTDVHVETQDPRSYAQSQFPQVIAYILSCLFLFSFNTSLNSLLEVYHICPFSHAIPVSTHFF